MSRLLEDCRKQDSRGQVSTQPREASASCTEAKPTTDFSRLRLVSCGPADLAGAPLSRYFLLCGLRAGPGFSMLIVQTLLASLQGVSPRSRVREQLLLLPAANTE